MKRSFDITFKVELKDEKTFVELQQEIQNLKLKTANVKYFFIVSEMNTPDQDETKTL